MFKLRLFLIIILFIFLIVGFSSAKEKINIQGSTTVLPIIQIMAEEFMNDYPEYEVTISGGGSGVGIAALIDQIADIAMSSREIKENELQKAREKGVTITEYLTAALILSVDAIQRRRVAHVHRLKPVKICVPINLRNVFPSKTLRNFANYVNPGIDPRLGEYTFDETLNIVHHTMAMEVTKKLLNVKITTNVR